MRLGIRFTKMNEQESGDDIKTRYVSDRMRIANRLSRFYIILKIILPCLFLVTWQLIETCTRNESVDMEILAKETLHYCVASIFWIFIKLFVTCEPECGYSRDDRKPNGYLWKWDYRICITGEDEEHFRNFNETTFPGTRI